MSTQAPIVDIKVRLVAQDIAAAIMLHEQEISNHVEAGVAEATKNIGLLISEKARSCATDAINAAVSNYFQWGDGHKAINLAVQKALSDILKTEFKEQP